MIEDGYIAPSTTVEARPALSSRGKRGRQRGASLLEGIAYLGIAAIVVIGAIALLRTALGSANANSLTTQIASMQTATRKLFMMTQGAYGATSINASLVAAGGVPQGMATTAAGAITNTWGGPVIITGAGTTFTVEYDDVPQDVCVDALTSTTTSWSSVAVTGGTATLTLPVKPSDAQTDCAASNTITWTSN